MFQPRECESIYCVPPQDQRHPGHRMQTGSPSDIHQRNVLLPAPGEDIHCKLNIFVWENSIVLEGLNQCCLSGVKAWSVFVALEKLIRLCAFGLPTVSSPSLGLRSPYEFTDPVKKGLVTVTDKLPWTSFSKEFRSVLTFRVHLRKIQRERFFGGDVF